MGRETTATLRLTAECSTVELPGSAQQFCFHSNTAIEITPLERLVPHWFQPRIFRILFVKPRNRSTDSQRLRRNVLREIHEHSALDRMLFLPGQRFGKPSPLRAAARIETRTSTKSAFFSQLDYFPIARDQEQSGDHVPQADLSRPIAQVC